MVADSSDEGEEESSEEDADMSDRDADVSEGGSDSSADSSEEEAAGDATKHVAGAPSVRPLVADKLKLRTLIVPREQFPTDTCSEHGGLGWSARVVDVKHGTARVKFIHGEWEPYYFPKSLVLHGSQ